MSFSVHTFETNPQGNLGFAFHQNIGEGQELYFLAKFSEKTIEPVEIAEAIFGDIVDFLEQTRISDSYDKFEEALKIANNTAQKFRSRLLDLPDIVISFFDFHHLYLTQCGKSEAYLIRDENVSQITEVSEDSNDLFVNILSGQVSIEDIVLLTSHKILKKLTSNQLVEIFERQEFSQAVGLFRHELSTKSEEDTLITCIGIGKSQVPHSPGFLSKVMSVKDKILENSPNTKIENKINNYEDPKDNNYLEDKTKGLKETNNNSKTTNYPDNSVEKSQTSVNRFKDKIPKFGHKIDNFKKLSKIPKMPNINKNAGLLGFTLFCIFILTVLWKSFSGDSEIELKLKEEKSLAVESLQQAETYLLQGERKLAKDALNQAEKHIQEVLQSDTKLFRSDANFTLAAITEKRLQVENAHEITPSLLADLGVKNDNLDAIGAVNLKGNFYIFDTKQVHKTVRNIVEKALPLSDTSSIIAAVAQPSQNVILFLTTSPGIIEYKEGLLNNMKTADDQWKGGIDIKNFGRYAYILDPTGNQIWKYERKRTNYSNAIPYNQGADLSQAVSFAIDGALYVLAENGSLQKIFRGKKVDYSFKDLPSTKFQGKNLKIKTTQDFDFLYVLDPDNRRLLIFVKGDTSATYKKQIIFNLPESEIPRDFIIDESEQRAYIITQNKVYEFSL
jgi:hypothetical protein